MAVTIEKLKEKIAHIHQDLEEVTAALEEMAPSQSTISPNPLAALGFSDKKALLPILDKALAEMGIDVSQPSPTPEEVQQLLLQEGVKPEDNIFSNGIIEMREE